jgi:hypothetical protein
LCGDGIEGWGQSEQGKGARGEPVEEGQLFAVVEAKASNFIVGRDPSPLRFVRSIFEL